MNPESIAKLEVIPGSEPFGEADRRLILAMSKAIVSISQEQQAPSLAPAAELAQEQYKYRQKFFPETIEP